ncbi:MAG: UPF0147 family protein [Candidatus Aenigmarchaeota archaeon]|nr:UPF0147 family protein [Candidatus Aenigmarchaeota archaeon]
MSRTEVVSLLEAVVKDRGVPKNVKNSIEESLEILRKDDKNNEKISEAASILDEISNDPNLSVYSRTVLWDAISKLEALK